MEIKEFECQSYNGIGLDFCWLQNFEFKLEMYKSTKGEKK